MIEFKTSEREINDLQQSFPQLQVILDALDAHQEIDVLILPEVDSETQSQK
ncbi:MAG: hypothetical protein HKN50_11230 [Gammaproteobacteria bacterium]|nr:hypothetical protein [Gammaproteobacteria bacterium]